MLISAGTTLLRLERVESGYGRARALHGVSALQHWQLHFAQAATGLQFDQAYSWLEVADNCSEPMVQFLLQQFALKEDDLYRVNGPVNLVRMMNVPELIALPALKFKPFTPGLPKALARASETVRAKSCPAIAAKNVSSRKLSNSLPNAKELPSAKGS